MIILTRIAIILFFSLLAIPSLAQDAVTSPYEDSNCGFRLSHPKDWAEFPNIDEKTRLELVSPEALPTIGKFLLIHDYKDPRMGLAGEWVMTDIALADPSLAWVNHFSIGRILVHYFISSSAMTVAGQTHDGYWFGFVLASADHEARNLPEVEWTVATMTFWTPKERLRQLEPVIMDIVRSVRFLKPSQIC